MWEGGGEGGFVLALADAPTVRDAAKSVVTREAAHAGLPPLAVVQGDHGLHERVAALAGSRARWWGQTRRGALVPFIALIALITLFPFVALIPLIPFIAFVPLITFVPVNPFVALIALIPFIALISLIPLIALVPFVAVNVCRQGRCRVLLNSHDAVSDGRGLRFSATGDCKDAIASTAGLELGAGQNERVLEAAATCAPAATPNHSGMHAEPRCASSAGL